MSRGSKASMPAPARGSDAKDAAPAPTVENDASGRPAWLVPRSWAFGNTGLLVLAFVCLVGVYVIELLRGQTLRGTRIRRVLSLVAYGLRLLAIGAVFAMIASFAPETVPLLGWGLLALVVFLLVAGRDLLRDVVAWLTIGFERRIRPGVWLSGGWVSGQVERIGLRSTVVVGDSGRRVVVPNRRFLEEIVGANAARWAERTMEVRIDSRLSVVALRAILRDAVLSSPWVPVDARPEFVRDSEDGSKWTIRTPVLAPGWGACLEGEIIERVNEAIEAHRHASASLDP
ncbi:MAG: mechanosensitive ion channel [Deltaproteobacteria bacterium]|nr:mechanosensitive ion channel [Deltaproteobacteria bacterium]